MPASAKEGIGIAEILEAIVELVPPPTGRRWRRCARSIFDTWYDTYRGVDCLVRVVEGTCAQAEDQVHVDGREHLKSTDVGVFAPKARGKPKLIAGEVGFVVANVKIIQDAKVGDTITSVAASLRQAGAGLQGDQADGLFGHLPDRLGRL